MTRKIAVVGAPASGKTLFSINWCEYLGATRLYYYELNGTGRRKGTITPSEARKRMVSKGRSQPARTFIINQPGQSPSRLAITDTFSLLHKTILNAKERMQLSFTLKTLATTDIILNLVDLTCSDPHQVEFIAAVDRHLSEFSTRRAVHYKLLGNKIDLLKNRSKIPGWPVSGPLIPISVKTRAGFELLREKIF